VAFLVPPRTVDVHGFAEYFGSRWVHGERTASARPFARAVAYCRPGGIESSAASERPPTTCGRMPILM
jgi:hypothetical protein